MQLPPKWRRQLPWIWGAFIFILVGILFFSQRAEVMRAWPYLLRADYRILFITGACEIVFFALQGLAAKLLYRMYDHDAGIVALTAMLFQATMLNEVLPTSGLSGTAGFIYWGNRLGYGLRDSIIVNVWLSLASYAALLPILVICGRALQFLPSEPRYLILSALEIAGAFTFLCVLLFIGLYVFISKTGSSEDVNPVVKRSQMGYYVRQGLKHTVARYRQWIALYTRAELGKEWRKVSSHPWQLSICTLSLLLIYAVRVFMLSLCFAAVHQPIPLSTLTFVYSLTLLFSVVSLSPTTLGVVEIALTTSLGWFGVPLPVAVAGTVLYRITSFWFPIPVGLLSQYWLGRKPAKISASKIG